MYRRADTVTVRAVLSALTLLLSAAEAVELNPSSTSYDDHPSVSITPDGTTWIAWHTYKDGVDGIAVRRLGGRDSTDVSHSFGRAGIVNGCPTIVASSPQHAWLVWSSKLNGRWQVLVCEWREGSWSDSRRVSNEMRDAIFPTAIQDANGALVIAWSERIGGHYRIRAAWFGTDASPEFHEISDGVVDAYRPTLTLHGEELWAFWDQYENSNYSVHGRRFLPGLGELQRISPQGRFCLTPTALSHSTGLYVAWLGKTDVIGGPGVISQLHTLQAAKHTNDQWLPILDAKGSFTGAELTQGLMAKISPRVVATGGYLGARVRPMLHASGDRVWMLWERKSDHRGSTPAIAGDLLGRPIHGRTWQQPVLLHQGYVDYHVVRSTAESGNQFSVIASSLPQQGRRIYERFNVALADARPFKQEKWLGWNATTLPIQREIPPHRVIESGGKTYRLFWADLHCHSNLSADAEGEIDELNHYARDRAGLDVVAFTENDFYNVPLTQYEYQLGNLFAENHSVADEFLSFPGYEWTSRIPGVATASLGDPGNWLPPYRNRSYANHRSVIYPPGGGPLVHFTEVGNDIERLNEAVARAGGITLSQHPTFQLSGHAVEVGLELTSGWGTYIARNPKLFHDSLDQGRRVDGVRLGFVANGDSHRRAPGLSGALTGIYAQSLTHEAILDALRNRRCFATSGSRIFIDARCEDSLMGEEFAVVGDQVTLDLRAIGTRAITSATLVRNGEEVYRIHGTGGRELHARFLDHGLSSGVHWYYWRVAQDDAVRPLPGNLMVAHGHLAWSSPHWVVVD